MKVVWGKFGTGVDLIVCAISSYWWVSLWVNTEKLPKLDDITDSMAIAICHAHSSKFSSQFKL